MDNVLMVETLTNLLGGKNAKKADEVIGKAVQVLLENFSDSGLYQGETQSFFISRDAKRSGKRLVDVLEMNVELFDTVQKFNSHSSDKKIFWPVEKARNYFMVKARLADNVDDAYNSLRGLVATSHLPYLTFESQDDKLSSGSILLKDWMGAQETFNFEIQELELVSTDGKKRVSILKNANFDKETSKITYSGVKGLQPGRYYIEL